IVEIGDIERSGRSGRDLPWKAELSSKGRAAVTFEPGRTVSRHRRDVSRGIDVENPLQAAISHPYVAGIVRCNAAGHAPNSFAKARDIPTRPQPPNVLAAGFRKVQVTLAIERETVRRLETIEDRGHDAGWRDP